MEFELPFPRQNDAISASFLRWKSLKHRFDCYKEKKKRDGENVLDDSCHQSLLLYLGGEEVYSIVQRYLLYQNPDMECVKKSVNELLCKIENHCLPLFMVLYERFKFFTYQQNEADNIVKYIIGLKNVADYCELLENATTLIQSQMQNGIHNETIRRILNQKKPLSFKEMLSLCLKHSNLQKSHLRPVRIRKRGSKIKIENTVNFISEICGIDSDSDFSDNLNNSKNSVQLSSVYGNRERNLLNKSLPFSQNLLPEKVESSQSKRKNKNFSLSCTSQSVTKTEKKSSKTSMKEKERCSKTISGNKINGVKCADEVDSKSSFSKRNDKWNQDTENVTYSHISEEDVLTEITDDKHELQKSESPNLKKTKIKVNKIVRGVENKNRDSDLIYEQRKKCLACKTVFLSTHLLNLHNCTYLNHQQDKCDICHVAFFHPLARSNHMRHSHPELLTHKCEECNMSFDLQAALDQHSLTHSKTINCPESSKTFSRSMDYNQHHKKEHKNLDYTCDKCGMNFPFPSKLKLHLMSKHNATKPYMCEICGSSFAEHNMLINHKNIHSGIKRYECVTCGRRFMLKSSLNNHMPTHLDEKPHVCIICGLGFKIANYLTSHMKIHCENRVRRHVCSTCGAAFLKSSQLKNHERKHTGEKPYKCDICGTVFTQLSSMKKHVKRVHEGIKPKDRFSCEYCGLSFTFSCKLKLHLMKHTGERPFTCNICNSTYREKHHLMHHMKTHSGQEPYKCPVCDRRFLQKSYLEGHLRKHTGEKPFSCSVCSARFTHKGYLRDHLKIHNQNRERNYKCSVCGKAFTCSSHMRSHERLHSGEKPHSCPVCDSKFTKRSSVKKHLKRAHGTLNMNNSNPTSLAPDGSDVQREEEHAHNAGVPVLLQELHSSLQMHSHPHHDLHMEHLTHFSLPLGLDVQTELTGQTSDDVSDVVVSDLQPQHHNLHTLLPAAHAPMQQPASAHHGSHVQLHDQLTSQMLSDMHINLQTSSAHSQLVSDIHIYTVSS